MLNILYLSLFSFGRDPEVPPDGGSRGSVPSGVRWSLRAIAPLRPRAEGPPGTSRNILEP